ncbi:MAG: von Willebrand factor type A domain-containing protein [Prolixibacteraceae bacterium]|nr:von Willebrand factor type A domain-containing protein [Prolixibacteraceae bacterium]
MKRNYFNKYFKFCSILIFILGSFLISAAQNRITGIVTELNNKPLNGVIVEIKDRGYSSKTSKEGFYSIEVDSLSKTIFFSLKGYKTIEIPIGSSSTINISLKKEENINSEKVTKTKEKYIHKSQLAGSALMVADCFNMPAPLSNDFNTEDYSTINESGFKNVLINPLSTFSIDVDNASYSNIRRFINMGQLPPKDAVRIEEMINYFHYEYKEPTEGEPFSIITEYTDCPWNEGNKLLHVALQGKKIKKDNLPPSNIVFLLDVSGSMNYPNKLPLVKSAMKILVDELRPQDKVSIVVYAGAAGLVLNATSGENKRQIIDAIDNLNAGGSTAGGEGLKLAYKIAGENFIKNGNNRIILATDGDFNVGVSSDSEMERLVSEEKKKGVFITVLGFGMGNYKDNKLEIIADKGNGNYAYIDNFQEARKVLISEFGGTLFTIAKDVKFQIEFNPDKVKAYRLIGYENRQLNAEDFNNDKKDAGEMGAGHQVTALYEIITTDSNTEISKIDELRYQENKKISNEKYNDELLTIKVRFKDPDKEESKLISVTVKDNCSDINKATENLKFIASVAQFGMLLRESEYKGNSNLKNTIELARTGKGKDENGYAGEFIRLIEAAHNLGLK